MVWKIILIIVGVIVFVWGFRLSLHNDPMMRTLLKTMSGQVYDEALEEKDFLERKDKIQYKVMRRLSIGSMIAGVLMVAVGLFLIFAPTGYGSLMSPNEIGGNQVETAELDAADKLYSSMPDGGEKAREGYVYITVRERTVSIGTYECDSVEDLAERVGGSYFNDKTIVLRDDYAVASTYKEVMQTLAAAGRGFREEGIE